jgi:hypothetical protein
MGSTLDLRRVIGHVRQLLKGRTTSGAERLARSVLRLRLSI